MNPLKSYKREAAVVAFVWFMYIVETKDVAIIQILAFPTFALVGGCFGLDGYAKLLKPKPSEPSDR